MCDNAAMNLLALLRYVCAVRSIPVPYVVQGVPIGEQRFLRAFELPRRSQRQNGVLLVPVLVLLLLVGGGGFYFGGPVIGGEGLGLVLLIYLIISFTGGFRAKTSLNMSPPGPNHMEFRRTGSVLCGLVLLAAATVASPLAGQSVGTDTQTFRLLPLTGYSSARVTAALTMPDAVLSQQAARDLMEVLAQQSPPRKVLWQVDLTRRLRLAAVCGPFWTTNRFGDSMINVPLVRLEW